MDPSDFIPNAAGEIVKTVTGYHAYVPSLDPPQIDYNAISVELSRADAALSELSGLGRFIPNPHLLIRPYVRREAVASSRIEGTEADLSDLFADELDPDATPPASDVSEVRNYVAALELGLAELDRLPLAGRLVRLMHAELLAGVRGQEYRPGEFRVSQNWIGGSGPTNARFVPPPPDVMPDCFAAWERLANDLGGMPDLVRCAVMHERFEAIHPFLDGNGRIGRLLITLFLIHRGRLSRPLLYLSSYIERHKADYYDTLQRVRTHGDWVGWLRYFLAGVEQTATGAVRHADAILTLHDKLRDLPELKGKHRAQNFVGKLFDNPFTSVNRTARLLGVSTPTAAKSIALLERLGVLEEATGRSWGRVWVARPILEVFQDPPEPPTTT